MLPLKIMNDIFVLSKSDNVFASKYGSKSSHDAERQIYSEYIFDIKGLLLLIHYCVYHVIVEADKPDNLLIPQGSINLI